jgi:hypothetical protein
VSPPIHITPSFFSDPSEYYPPTFLLVFLVCLFDNSGIKMDMMLMEILCKEDGSQMNVRWESESATKTPERCETCHVYSHTNTHTHTHTHTLSLSLSAVRNLDALMATSNVYIY